MKIRLFAESKSNDETVFESGKTGEICIQLLGHWKVRLPCMLFLNINTPFVAEFGRLPVVCRLVLPVAFREEVNGWSHPRLVFWSIGIITGSESSK